MANKRRLIDADELRRRILAFATGLHSEVLPVDTVIMLLTQMQDVDPVRQWIPVTERMPDESGNYIVTACDEDVPYGEGIWYDTVVVYAEYYKGSWTSYENGTEYDLCGLVTHWMPLPEPPEEEKHE